MRVGIFCSANNTIDEVYFEKATELGVWLAQNGHEVVFGGCNLGLMECVAQAAQTAGGRTIGVVPDIIERHGKVSPHTTEVLRCKNLNERKAIMLEESDVFIALPGGVGTLDEVFTVVASYTIGYHEKHVILYNINGFWDDLFVMLDNMAKKGVVNKPFSDFVHKANTLDELVALIEG